MTSISVTEHAGAELLRAVARGVIDLSSQDRVASFALPYPTSAQLALDRTVLTCLNQHEAPPAGVPELIVWCRDRILAEWPLTMPVGFVTPDSRLIDENVCLPTRTCAELASDGPLGFMEQEASALLGEVAAGCSSTANYQSCRDFLIRRTVVTQQNLMNILRNPRDAMAWKRVSHLYGTVPDAYVLDGKFAVCPTCQSLALPLTDGATWCESEMCPRAIEVEPSYEAAMSRVLRTPLRIFLTLPGRTELVVRQRLARCGVTVELVPGALGSYQLSRPTGETWTMRVYDRVQPTLLAARMFESITPDDSRTLVVVPDHVVRHRPDFRAAFDRLTPADADLALVAEDELATATGTSDHDDRRNDNA